MVDDKRIMHNNDAWKRGENHTTHRDNEDERNRNKKQAKERRSKDETKKTFAAALRTCGGASRLRRRFAPAAPLRACGGASRLQRRFAPAAALRAIEKHEKRQKVR